MIKLWPSTPVDQLTPRASADGRERINPFDASIPASPTNPPHSPSAYASFQHHHLLTKHARSPSYEKSNPLAAAHTDAGDPNLTPIGPGVTPPSVAANPASYHQFAAALPTTQLSLHAPEFKMQQPAALRLPKHPLNNPTPLAAKSQATPTSTKTATPSFAAPPATSSVAPSAIQAQKPIGFSNASQTAAKEGANGTTTNGSRGQIHVKVLQARNLNIRPHPLAVNPRAQARPYVVVQFEQNEFISRDPIREHEREVKGVATALSRNASSTALEALGAINARALEAANRRNKVSNGKEGAGSGGSAGSSPSSTSSEKSGRTLDASAGVGGLFGRSTSPHNPVWKHEVSLYVSQLLWI